MLAAQMSPYNETEWSEGHGERCMRQRTTRLDAEVTPDPDADLKSSLKL